MFLTILKTPYLFYTDSSCSPSVQPCLKQAVLAPASLKLPPKEPTLIGLLSEAAPQQTYGCIKKVMQQTIVVRFHYFFSFFT